MELKEGMYVRTKDGFIDKVINDYKGCCDSPNCNCKHVSCEHNYYDEENIIKSSDNPIDLIKVGDYVNGYKVYSGGENHFDYVITWDEERNYYMKIELPSVDIKSIVTKEVFYSVKYEVE